jgi:hypothetical protein
VPIAASLIVLALPASAFGQATRTWVSGVGDDANPCSRTAPCKTWAGAISKTAAGGEIDALDPGGFGTLTITKAITISGQGVVTSTLASGVPGFLINAGINDRVTLQHISINGISGSAQSPGTNGVQILQAKSVRLQDVDIYGFGTSGVDFRPANADSRLVIANSNIHDGSGLGVFAEPPNGSSGRVNIVRSSIDGNACGLVAAPGGAGGSCGPTAGSGVGGGVLVNAVQSTFQNNASGAGVFANGAGAAVILSANTITGNNNGLLPVNGGTIFSLGNNELFGNTTPGSANGGNIPLVSKDSSAKLQRKIWARIQAHVRAMATEKLAKALSR